ncbi:hypothetical protein GCM10023080_033270 [Streptomyces pseudoechinosporeus]
MLQYHLIPPSFVQQPGAAWADGAATAPIPTVSAAVASTAPSLLRIRMRFLHVTRRPAHRSCVPLDLRRARSASAFPFEERFPDPLRRLDTVRTATRTPDPSGAREPSPGSPATSRPSPTASERALVGQAARLWFGILPNPLMAAVAAIDPAPPHPGSVAVGGRGAHNYGLAGRQATQPKHGLR